jgi:hypothetical protein
MITFKTNKTTKILYLLKVNLKLFKNEMNTILRKTKIAAYILKDDKKRENIEKTKATTITNPKKLKFSVLDRKSILCS